MNIAINEKNKLILGLTRFGYRGYDSEIAGWITAQHQTSKQAQNIGLHCALHQPTKYFLSNQKSHYLITIELKIESLNDFQ